METKGSLVILGFGSQAKAWALNLRDSGREVVIMLRKNSPSESRVKELNFPVLEFNDSTLSDYQNFLVLTPDETHAQVLRELSPHLSPDSRMIYAHGYSYLKDQLKSSFPKVSHLLLAPKAIASEVRFQYETKGKLGAAISFEGSLYLENDRAWLNQLAHDLGITGSFECTFQEECFADLFSEQSLLCGLLPYASLHSFNKLIEKGIPKEIAYMECWLEVKLIADAMIQKGPEDFFRLISPNALIGGEKAQSIIFDKEYQKHLEQLAEEIWSGDFFKEVSATDFKALQCRVVDFWKSQELTKTHSELAPKLIP